MKQGRFFSTAAAVGKKLRPGKPMIVGALLSVASAAAMAATGDYSSLTGLTDIICTISNLISGPYLYGIGIILIVIGGVAVANSESNIAKTFSVVLVGLGIASVAVPIMRDHFHMTVAC
ncbi:TrbC/VirB2 family protein [Paraburkholderia sp. PGU19]|uniref:TrbC/VirB2 family protein n=1 Tax=Paraburkholderia sp. PGU19 TaxID=2735434 RepID=UPI0015DAD726|nr:TrbC/VirB2 family protein [Paraburkholderia sp. PGU19]